MGPGIGLHGDIVLPYFADMVELSPAQRKAVMLVREGVSEQYVFSPPPSGQS